MFGHVESTIAFAHHDGCRHLPWEAVYPWPALSGGISIGAMSGDMTIQQILADYPDLEADDLRAAIAYGARLSRIKSIEPVAA